MHRRLLFWVLLGSLAATAACSCGHNSTNKAAQLHALDDAYKSGVFTKQEYDAKKAAIQAEGQAPSAPPPTTAVAPTPPPAESGPIGSASAQAAGQPGASTAPADTGNFAPAAVSAAPRAQPLAANPAPAPPPDLQRGVSGALPAKADSNPQEQAASSEPPKTCDDASYKGNASGPQTRFYAGVAVDRARKAALDSLALLDFEVRKNDGDEIEGVKRRHKVSMLVGAGGEHEVLHFQDAQRDGRKGTLVTGETKRNASGFLAQKNWSATVLSEMACQLR